MTECTRPISKCHWCSCEICGVSPYSIGELNKCQRKRRDLERNERRTVRLGKLVVGMFCVWMLAIIVNVAWELWKL